LLWIPAFAGMTTLKSGRSSLAAFPRKRPPAFSANIFTVIPAKAGIQEHMTPARGRERALGQIQPLIDAGQPTFCPDRL
jgi:hypothetical protein